MIECMRVGAVLRLAVDLAGVVLRVPWGPVDPDLATAVSARAVEPELVTLSPEAPALLHQPFYDRIHRVIELPAYVAWPLDPLPLPQDPPRSRQGASRRRGHHHAPEHPTQRAGRAHPRAGVAVVPLLHAAQRERRTSEAPCSGVRLHAASPAPGANQRCTPECPCGSLRPPIGYVPGGHSRTKGEVPRV